MIIQGTPEILRGPRGLNGFGDFGDAGFQTTVTPMAEGFYASPEYSNWARSIPSLVVDVNTGYQSPYFGPLPGGTFGPTQDRAYEAFKARAGRAPVLTAAKAKELMYKSSTTGASTIELNAYGGLSVVRKAAIAAGWDFTPQKIKEYEIEQGLPKSAATIANERFIGAEGEALAAQIEANLNSESAAVAAQARADEAAVGAAARAAVAAQAAAQAKQVSDAYYAAQAAAKAVEAARTLAAKQAAEAQRARALVAVKALFVQVLEREGDEKGLNYFADRFGDVIDPDELQIFKDMAQPEIDARNEYLAGMADMAAATAAANKALADSEATVAARANAQAANLARETAEKTAALAAAARNAAIMAEAAGANAALQKAVADAAATVAARAATTADETKAVTNTTGGGINPMLLLAVAAAAFFIGG